MTEEMSGHFLRDGHHERELTVAEWRSRQLDRAESRLAHGKKSFSWLARQLGLSEQFDLRSLIVEAEVNGSASLYDKPRLIEKQRGGSRIIITPKPELLLVQKGIKKLLHRTFERPTNVLGYRGGSALEVAKRHAPWASTLKFDVRDAFFQISRKQLYRELQRSGFSKYVAWWLTSLCTYSPSPPVVEQRFGQVSSFLPQGAPTSPICFCIASRPLDEKLSRIAARVGGIVSRYADNYFFSMPTPEISDKLETMIICDAVNRGFPVHKVRRVPEGELYRVLGYNIMDGQIRNTRDFYRNFRGALYVLETKLERGLPWEEAYARVRGYRGYAVNLPLKLQEAYDRCMTMIEGLLGGSR